MFFLSGTFDGPVVRRLVALLLCASSTACVDVERVPFEIRIVDQACSNRPSLDRLELLLLPLEPGGQLCLQSQKTVPADQRSAITLETGSIDFEELVVAALAYGGAPAQGCVQCYALARVPLQTALTRYNLALAPATDCKVPQVALEGLGLPADSVPASRKCP